MCLNLMYLKGVKHTLALSSQREAWAPAWHPSEPRAFKKIKKITYQNQLIQLEKRILGTQILTVTLF